MIKRLFEKYSSLRYVLSSGAAWVVDNGLYFVLLRFVFSPMAGLGAVAASTCAQIIARVVSSFFNFNCNNFFVFKSEEKYSKALYKYYCLCIPQACVSVLLLDVAIKNLTISNDLVQTGIKILIEVVLFAISYVIQNKWVFKKKNNE